MIPPVNAGHGTHVSGVMVANVASGQGIQGTCKHCGLGISKATRTACVTLDGQIHLFWNASAEAPSLTAAVDKGAQIVNMSFGGKETGNFDFCHIFPSNALCLAIDYAAGNDVAMVASSGNDRKRLESPASDPDIVAVGGIDASLNFWDESPGSYANCPPLPPGVALGTECGSNLTTESYLPKQEFVAPAKAVLSTTYPNLDWSSIGRCGDHYPGPGAGSGVGECTGTSMSAPAVSRIFGILRSINPLVESGTPSPQTGVRGVLAATTHEALASQPWEAHFGYGRPNAEAAAKKMIGTVGGGSVKRTV